MNLFTFFKLMFMFKGPTFKKTITEIDTELPVIFGQSPANSFGEKP